jgi:hypothetical protein
LYQDNEITVETCERKYTAKKWVPFLFRSSLCTSFQLVTLLKVKPDILVNIPLRPRECLWKQRNKNFSYFDGIWRDLKIMHNQSILNHSQHIQFNIVSKCVAHSLHSQYKFIYRWNYPPVLYNWLYLHLFIHISIHSSNISWVNSLHYIASFYQLLPR